MAGRQSDRHLARIAFGLLIAGELIQLVAILVGGAVYPAYDPLRQYISELGATGAVTGPAVSWFGFVPSGVLMTMFCLIAAWLLRRNVLAVVGALLLGWYCITLSAAGVYPCAFECGRAEPSLNALMHDLFGGTGYLAALAGVVVTGLSARSGRAAWLAPAGAACAVVVAVGFAAMIVDVAFGGLLQRALEGSLAAFLLAFGWALAKGRLATAPGST